MHGHLQTPPPPLREFNPLIPPQVEAVILHALVKEPAERYEDMLTFARAYQEALEDAASAQTHAQQCLYASRTGRQVNVFAGAATFTRSAPTLDTSELCPEADKADEPKSGQTAAITNESTHAKREGKLEGAALQGTSEKHQYYKTRVAGRRHGRGTLSGELVIPHGYPIAIGLVLLVLLFVSGGTLGFMRVTNPCLLGMCPGMQLSTNDVNIINDNAQVVKITNPGSTDLQWQAAQLNNFSWLTLSPMGGVLAPGKISSFTMTTHTAGLQNGQYIEIVRVTGQGVAAQNVQVTLSVQKGLSQVTVTSTGLTFLYEHGKLRPSSQTITITNKSGHRLDFSTKYNENSWLQVTPGSGSLDDEHYIDLKINVVIVQSLNPSANLANVSIIGKLDNQSEPALLQSYNFTLTVAQSPLKATSA
jgi:hypothetical protein